MRKLILLAALLLLSTGCATHKAYLNPQFSSATAAHRQVAVLPFHVAISRERLPSQMTDADIVASEREEGFAVQTQLLTQLLRRSDQFRVEFQDVARTNALLERAGLGYDSLRTRTPDEIARVLGVDAVISGSIRRSRPMGTKTGVVVAVLVGAAFARTNEVGVDLQLNDAKDGALLWTFSHKFGGSLGSSPERLADAMMNSIAKRFPYRRDPNAAPSPAAQPAPSGG